MRQIEQQRVAADFFMIQRRPMLLPDDHAKETLAGVRAQIQEVKQ